MGQPVARDLRLRLRRRLGGELLFLLPALAFGVLFALLPAVALFARSWSDVGGLPGWEAILRDPLNRLALQNSFGQGALSAALAVGLGYPVGLFVGRYRWPGRSALRSVLLVPFLLPSLVVVLGVLDLFGPAGLLSGPVPALASFGRGIPGIVAANLVFNVPIVVLFTAAGCDAAAPELEEAVRTLGGNPRRAYRDAWGPSTWVGAAAGGLLTFLFSALSFAPPLLLCGTRCYTVEARVYSLDSILLAPDAAGLLALTAVLVFLVPTALYLLLLGRLRAQPGRARRTLPRVPWRSPVAVALAAVTAAVVVAEGAVLAAVLYRTVVPSDGAAAGTAWSSLFSGTTAQRLGISVPGAILNTLAFAVAASAITVLLGIAAGHAVARRPGRARLVGLALFVPLLVSPVVLAIAVATFWRPILGGVSTTWVLVIASQTVLAIPFAIQSIEIPLASLGRGPAEAARALGASPWVAFLDADLPRVRQGLATAGLFAFALGLGEFTATNFLVTGAGGFTTLPVALYTLQSARLGAAADAAAGLLLLLSLAVFLVLSLGGRRVEL